MPLILVAMHFRCVSWLSWCLRGPRLGSSPFLAHLMMLTHQFQGRHRLVLPMSYSFLGWRKTHHFWIASAEMCLAGSVSLFRDFNLQATICSCKTSCSNYQLSGWASFSTEPEMFLSWKAWDHLASHWNCWMASSSSHKPKQAHSGFLLGFKRRKFAF